MVRQFTLRDMIKRSGLTVEQFSRYYDIPYRTVQNWIEGQRKPPKYILSLLERCVIEDFDLLRQQENRKRQELIEEDRKMKADLQALVDLRREHAPNLR